MESKRILIAAISENDVIGYKGTIPREMKAHEDMKHFRQLTLEYPVIMGRKTHDSIGGPLDRRLNIVITRNRELSKKISSNVRICHSMEEALDEASRFNELSYDLSNLAETNFHPKIFFIGGGEIYKEALEKGFIDSMAITKIHQHVRGDTYFPRINWNEWIETQYQKLDGLSFISYDKI